MDKILLALLFALLITMNCSNSGGEDIAGTLTETKNSAVFSGRVLNIDGTPAGNVKVRFVSKDHDPGAGSTVSLEAKDSCLTDENGYYYTNALTSGTWNVLAANTSNSGKVFVDSVVFTGETLKVNDAALAAPGGIRGAVRMQRGDDPKIVSVYVIGALAYSMVENDGGFGFGSMAKGRYKLRFRAFDPKYEVLDTVVDIASGANKAIDSPIVLPLRIPTPTGLKLTYDTLKQSVTLQWNAMNPLKVAGYNIYRQQVDSAEKKLNAVVFKAGTTFIDSTAVQDLRYIYRVASVDSMGNEGSFKTAWKDTVTIEPAFKLVSTFGGPGTGDGKFTNISDIRCLKDGRIIIVDFGAHSFQVFDTLGHFLFSRGSYGDSNYQFNYPISITEDDSGNIYILELMGAGRIHKYDKEGNFINSLLIGTLCTDLAYRTNKLFVVSSLRSEIKTINLLSGEILTIPINKDRKYNGIAYNKNNCSFIFSEESESKIITTDTSFVMIHSWGSFGALNGMFNRVTSISSTSKGNILVTDKDNGRIQIFNMLGNFLSKSYVPTLSTKDINNFPELKPTCSDLSKDDAHLFIATKTTIYKFASKQ